MSASEQPVPSQKERSAFWPLMALIVVAGATLLVLQLRSQPPPGAPASSLTEFLNKPLPILEAEGWLNTTGPLSANDLRGDVVLVDFWSTTCGPCLLHTPQLVDFYERFHGLGLEIVGLTHEAGAGVDRVRHYVTNTKGLDWPVGYGAQPTFKAMGIYGTPTYVLFDRTGRSVWSGHDFHGLEDATVAALAKKGQESRVEGLGQERQEPRVESQEPDVEAGALSGT